MLIFLGVKWRIKSRWVKKSIHPFFWRPHMTPKLPKLRDLLVLFFYFRDYQSHTLHFTYICHKFMINVDKYHSIHGASGNLARFDRSPLKKKHQFLGVNPVSHFGAPRHVKNFISDCMGKCQSQQHHLGDAYVRGSQRKHPWRARLFGTEMLGDPNYHNEVLVVFSCG